MMTSETSDDVAEDYRRALEDLTMNSRYEISNLTVIARENTEHAYTISEALKNHIKQTSPQKKLPAFYVLDSVVKNVGTPYTIFLSRGLYSTFMEAYALVDNNVRRKMDEMLKTWKEPVPGALDTRPVFPRDVTSPIENALIKARTSAIQSHQEHMRSQQQLMGRGRPVAPPASYRETVTPPNAYRQQPPQAVPGYPPTYNQPQYPPSINGQQYPGQPNANQQYGLPPRPSPQQYPQQNTGSSSWQQPQPQGYGAATENSIDTLNNDVANLITTSKADFAQNPYDSSIQKRLKALLDLQTILQSQKLPPDQIALIKDQVTELSKASKASPKAQSLPIIKQSTPVAATAPMNQPPAQQPSLSSILGPGALAALLARQSSTPQPAPPAQAPAPIRSPQQVQSRTYNPVQIPAQSSTPVTDPNSLLERLRAAGMLPGTPAPASTPTPVVPLPGTLPPGFPPPFLNTPPTSRTPLADIPNDVVLKPASLKIPRPHLISSLYEKLGAPCTQCGRRFQSDEEGRKKKTAHMDWHFRVHQRMAEAEKRGQHRSWYVDEMDWIKSREVEDDQNLHNSENLNSSGISGSSVVSKPKLQYLAVPDDPALASSLCPICQEKFEMKWLDEAQEFVWMDARKIGDRIYHASCYAEATKDSSNLAKRGTPEPVLGKRKAEDDHIALRSKINRKNEAPRSLPPPFPRWQLVAFREGHQDVLESVGIEADDERLSTLISELKGKNIQDLISEGSAKLASVPSGGSGGGAAAASGGAAAGGAAEEEKVEEKEEEKEESDEDMGFGLFD
ncbi:hypothetical protein G7Y89_g8510 [Cudoniella acicularis]|uniref:CID domain-containing protein n=1 Tax=Cudoniella acicularis TaxID=354080 RepID=A0A8H4RHC3_9HELO|nr:hypothetical protein G7Y89_g8510 [Cudoniella acicularis]